MQKQGHAARRTSPLLPPGRRLAAGRVRRRHEGRTEREGPAVMDGSRPKTRRPADAVSTRADEKRVWEVREARSARTAVPGQPDAYAGWEDSAVPPDTARRLPARPRHCSTSTTTTRRCTATSARAASTARHVRPQRRRLGQSSAASWTRRPTWSCLRRLALRRARRRPGTRRVPARRCSAPSCARRSASSSASGTRLNDEPGQGDRRLSDRREPAHSAPDYNPPQAATHFGFPTTTAASRSAALRCVGVGQVPTDRAAGAMCPSYR